MIIKNAKIISWTEPNRILEEVIVRVKDGIVIAIDQPDVESWQDIGEETIDARGQFLMPGLICAHTHFYGAFSRGMSIPGDSPNGFPEILRKLWWPLDRALDLEDVRNSAMVCIVDAIKHGTTTLIDHHASPSAVSGSLDMIAEAVLISGVRAALCYEVTDRNGKQGAKAGIEENKRFVELIKRNPNPRLAATFGLHASFTLSDETLSQARDVCPEDIGFHIHVAEHPVDQEDSMRVYGQRVISRLNRHGILGPRSIIVHAVHVDRDEIDLLASTNSWVTHQPRSNMNNAVGLPQVEHMLNTGVRVGLGNDGFSNCMWEEWKAAYLAHKLFNQDSRSMPADKVVRMAIYNNSQLVSELFNLNSLGKIDVGAPADLILVDYKPFTPMTADNLPWHIIFGFQESMVTMTMVAGKLLMKDRELLTLDEEKITRNIMKRIPEVWNRYSSYCA